jgi:transposase
MAKRIQLVGHLGPAALYGRYRAAADRVARSQLQIIWLLTSGKSLAEVAAASGYSTRWIQKLIHRYNAGGAAAYPTLRRSIPPPQRNYSTHP